MIALTLEGATAQLTRAEGERFVMLASRAYAPGTPLKATVDGSSEVLDLKVARSVRRNEGTYEVSGRLLNLTRPQRQLLDARLA
jgi:hypothetical protein